MIPPREGFAKTAGDWNSSRLIVKGDRFEHWLNGEKVNEGSLSDPRVVAGVEKRWKDVPAVREALLKPRPRGFIALQHHEDEVWFRNIRIRELK
jgi:cytochrome c